MNKYKVVVTKVVEIFASNEQEAEALVSGSTTISAKATEIAPLRFGAGTIFRSSNLELILVPLNGNSIASTVSDAIEASHFDLVIIKDNSDVDVGLSYGGRPIKNKKGVSIEDISEVYYTLKYDEHKLEVIKPVYYKEI